MRRRKQKNLTQSVNKLPMVQSTQERILPLYRFNFDHRERALEVSRAVPTFRGTMAPITRLTSLPLFNQHCIYVEYNTDRLSKNNSFAGKTSKEKSVPPLYSFFYNLLQPRWTVAFFPSVILSVSMGHWLNWPSLPGIPVLLASPTLTYPSELRSGVTATRKSPLTHPSNLH